MADTDSIFATHRLMNARKRGLVLEDAAEMVNWMAELGLVESPHGKTKAAATDPMTTPSATG